MIQKDELHQLIRGLNGPEKRYFIKEAKNNNGGKAPNYLKLFEAYAKMEDYDEATLKKLPYITYFAESRKHLFKKVLAYIQQYEKKHSYRFQLKELIADIRFLRKRQIWKQCRKYIRKAKKLANELDDQTSLLEIIDEERLLIINTPGRNAKREFQVLFRESNKSIDSLKLYADYVFLADYLYAVSFKDNRLNKESLKKLKEEVPLHLIQESKKDLPGRSLRMYLMARSFLNWLKKDTREHFETLSQLYHWWESRPKQAEEYQSAYLSDISNYMAATFRRQEWELMKSLLQKMKQIKPNSFYDQQLHFYLYSLYHILFALGTLDFEKATTISIGLKRGIKRLQLEGKRKLMLTINIAQLYFIREKFEDCAIELDPLTRGPVLRKENVRRVSHLLLMVTLYSLNRLDKLNSLYRRTLSVFHKMDISKDSFEFETVENINKLSNATPKEQSALMETFYDYLFQLIKNPETRNTLGLNLIYSWVKSRISGRKLAPVIKETETLYPS